ncbi:MAG: repeat protein, partial [Actinomycetia bacterium]|nr:repeat protein [Actinomycetes bacterium]
MRIRTLAAGWSALTMATIAVIGGSFGVEPAGAATCPDSNPPDEMAVSAGTPQTTKLATPFQTNLAVALQSSSGCPVTTNAAGVAVTFTAPSSGATGTFSTTGTSTATVGTTSSGAAVAPAFTANDSSGSYTVVATSAYGSVSFSLTNTATGVAVAIAATGGSPQSAPVGAAFGSPLRARLTDARGGPVAGATVTFAIVARNGADAAFATGAPTANAVTNSAGEATSPTLTANTTTGTYTATATTSGTTEAATFQLTNVAGRPYAITSGAGARQSAPAGAPFTVPLAVRVTDSGKNPVSGAVVTFHAPTSGPTGSFAGRGTTATVTTNANGIAVAPTFTANRLPGGYIVTAAVAGVRPPASFALVNQA